MKYPHCQADNREGAEFCGECGKPLRQDVICSQCGNSNPVGNKFCDKCGHSLTEKAPAPPKPKLKKPSIVETTSFAGGRYRNIANMV